MDEGQYVCMEEVRDTALRRELEGYLDPGTCSFCGGGSAGVVSFEVFMEEVMSAVHWRFQRAGDAGVPREDGDWAEATWDFHEVLQDTLWYAVDWAVADAVEKYDDGDAWVYRDYPWPNLDVAMRRGWTDFCALVHTHGDAVLLPQEERQWGYGMYGPREVLDHICEMAKRLSLIVPLPEGSKLWRSRIADAPINCTALEMGPAPAHCAAPNRMSPAGVSMFYGAEDARTAQREVTAHRSDPTTQSHLTTCAFSVAHHNCWILDLTDLPDVPSIFDRQQRNLYAFADFMQHFAAELTKPIPLDGTQHREYRPTQVFTQYLHRHAPLGVNGIRFRSAQDSEGVNYVLFAGPEDCTDTQSQQRERLLLIEPATMMHTCIEPSDQSSA